jgi:hypothetical protein
MNLQIEPEKIKQLIADLEAEANEDKLASYKPYLKQGEFHAAGAKHRERLLMERAISWARRLPAPWKPPFTQPAVILNGGKESASISQLFRGLLAPLARPFEIPCSAC